uniref:Uncharacterized protein n=1 Tax=Anguilla anguilla TaxID=7936 RepID=A0A0E9UK54_ANGAN
MSQMQRTNYPTGLNKVCLQYLQTFSLQRVLYRMRNSNKQ